MIGTWKRIRPQQLGISKCLRSKLSNNRRKLKLHPIRGLMTHGALFRAARAKPILTNKSQLLRRRYSRIRSKLRS